MVVTVSGPERHTEFFIGEMFPGPGGGGHDICFVILDLEKHPTENRVDIAFSEREQEELLTLLATRLKRGMKS